MRLTQEKLQIKYRFLQYLTFCCEFVAVAIPFLVICLVNWNEWFTTEEGWKVGLGGILVFSIFGILLLKLSKKNEDKNKNSGFISLIIGYYVCNLIIEMLSSILDSISTIMFFGGIGLFGAYFLFLLSMKFKFKADHYQEVILKAKENILQKQVEEEVIKNDSKVVF